jgi:hypothetical protein
MVQFRVPIYPKEDIKTQFIDLTTAGLLTIKIGYAWDYASGPTINYPRRHVIGQSLGHDALCQLHDEEHLDDHQRKQADKWFYQALKVNGMPWFRRKYWYMGVRIGSKKGKHEPKKVHSVIMKLP